MGDKVTAQPKGCAFVTYASPQGAQAAIAALHNRFSLFPPPNSPLLQVRLALSDGGQPSSNPLSTGQDSPLTKLFVGMLPTTATEADLTELFSSFGTIQEVAIMFDANNRS